jgi:AcrR family transcriptional regulator
MGAAVIAKPHEARPSEAKPRDRILAAARDLFRKHGLRGVGVDAIVEAADTNKMTLYRHFGSKDDLVVACLQQIAGEANAVWDRLAAEHPDDAMAQLRAWLRQGGTCGGIDGRGCSLANAAIELTEDDHPARHFIAGFKRSQHDRLSKLCREAGVAAAETLADTLSLMLEGARISRQTMGPDGLSSKFVASAEAVIASFVGAQAKPAGAKIATGAKTKGRA